MYSQSGFVYKSAKSNHPSKSAKDFKAKTNSLCDQFNHIYRNKDHFNADTLFDNIRDLTIEFIGLAAIQKPKKMQFEDVLTNNLVLGNNSRNVFFTLSQKKIVLFHIKLAELYLKSQLDLNVLLKSIDALNQFHLL